jgi:hypothetical protein
MEMHMLKKIMDYFESFDPKVKEGTRQALEKFGCCGEVLVHLDALKQEELERARITAEERSIGAAKGTSKRPKGAGKPSPPKREPEPHKMLTVVGFCPQCKSVVKGEPMPGCESKSSGRVFYKECTACKYYSEIFKKRNKHYEVEGG